MDTYLTSRGEITRLLKRVHQARSVLTVTLVDHKKPYTSSVLGVDDQADCLLLDELSPSDGHRRLETGVELRVFGRLDGIELSFNTGVTTIEQTSGIALYKSTLPDAVRYNQRREFHRVPAYHDVAVRIRNTQGQALESQLRDISLGGVSVQTTVIGSSGWLRRGATLLCDIPIGGGSTRVVTPVEIRHVRANPPNQTYVVGTCFTALDRLQRRNIQRYIASIERELVKDRSAAS